MQLLCERGADANAQTKRSQSTPLHLAAKRGHNGVIKILLEFDANIATQDAHGNCPRCLQPPPRAAVRR